MHFLVAGLQSPGLPGGMPTHTPAVHEVPCPSPLVQSVWLTLPTAPQKQAATSSGFALHVTMSAGGQQSMTFWERLQMLCDSPTHSSSVAVTTGPEPMKLVPDVMRIDASRSVSFAVLRKPEAGGGAPPWHECSTTLDRPVHPMPAPRP